MKIETYRQKKQWLVAGLLCTLFLALPIKAKSSLNMAEAFNILSINGISYSSNLFSRQHDLKLKTGLNLIAIEYEEVFESDDGDDFDIVKSDAFLLKIYLEKDADYKQRYLKPSNADAARRYIQRPVFDIIKIDPQSNPINPINFELKALSSNQSNFLADQTSIKQKIVLDLSHPSTKKSTQNNKQITTSQTNTSKRLNYWWRKATPEERKLFLESINQPATK